MDIKKIDETLKEKGFSQKEMCKNIGIKEQAYSNIKSSGVASVETILKIAKYLNINPITIAPEYSELFEIIEIKTVKESKESENETYNKSVITDSLVVIKDLTETNRKLTDGIDKLIDQSNNNQNTIKEYSDKIINFLTSQNYEKKT